MRLLLLLSLLSACTSDKTGGDTGAAADDLDGDGYAGLDDCDDTDAAVHPDATELCNGVDDDCDGGVDEDVVPTWYQDSDSDGYGDLGAATTSCDAPSGAIADASDCDDSDPNVNPAAAETCNGVDDNCDGAIDEAGGTIWFPDADADGYGDDGSASTECDQPSGTSEVGGDCDDGDALVNPDGVETCNEVDDDCDGAVDEDVAATWYLDTDGDGWGDTAATADACGAPSGYVADDGDCDEGDTSVYPGAPDACDDGIDQDCDGADDDCRLEGTHTASTATAALIGQAGELAGSRVTRAGDVDGDGVDDMWVGLYGYGPTSADYHGGVALVAGPISGVLDIHSAASAILAGEDASDYAGWDFMGGDDLDGDGHPDIAIGAYGAGSGGAAYIVSGAGISGDMSLADADAMIDALGATSNLGYDLDTSPDLTGDGIGDVILGSYGSGSDGYRGHAWIFAGPMSGSLDLGDATATVDGDNNTDLAGNGVGGVGDTNGDGVADLLVGAHGDDGAGDAAGAAGLFYGPLAGSNSMSDANRTVQGENPGDEISRNTVGGRGDVDGDGLDDVLIGAQFNSTYGSYAGALYLMLGSATETGTMSASATTVQVYGAVASDYLGRGFDLGDMDGDGFADVVVSAYADDTAGAQAGAVYVFYGPFSGSFVGADADATILGNDAGDYFGFLPGFIGDTDADGQDDLLVGAWFDADGGTNAGAAYLFP